MQCTAIPLMQGRFHVRVCCAVHGHVTPLVTEYFGNYTLQDLLGATQAFRLAAAKLRAEGKTSPQALEKLVGLRDGTDALGAAPSSPYCTSHLVTFGIGRNRNCTCHACMVPSLLFTT